MNYVTTHTYNELDLFITYEYKEDMSMFNQSFYINDPDIEIIQ